MTVIFLLRRKREAGEGAGLLEMVHSEQGDSRLSSSPVQGHLRNSGLTWGRSAPPPGIEASSGRARPWQLWGTERTQLAAGREGPLACWDLAALNNAVASGCGDG